MTTVSAQPTRRTTTPVAQDHPVVSADRWLADRYGPERRA